MTWNTAQNWPPENWPNDLDFHLWMSDTNLPMHISQENPGDCTNYPNACLEVDAQYGSGPETLAIRKLENAEYHVGVLNYYEGYPSVPAATDSMARVEVYDITGIKQEFTVPINGAGDLWYVFEMNRLGEITGKNCITAYPADIITNCP